MREILRFAIEVTASYCGYLFWSEEGFWLSCMYILFFYILLSMSHGLRNKRSYYES